MICSDRRVWSPSDEEYVPSALTPTVPVTAMMFPARTAREYPIFGSHFDPELAVFRPARSLTLMWMSLLTMMSVLQYCANVEGQMVATPAGRANAGHSDRCPTGGCGYVAGRGRRPRFTDFGGHENGQFHRP